MNESAPPARVQWWLMTCSFPDLHWARLQLFADDSADVLDHDGVLHTFAGEQAATDFLREDEYERLQDLDDESLRPHGLSCSELVLPQARSTAELVSLMCVNRRS